jgi:hypothetical protein
MRYVAGRGADSHILNAYSSYIVDNFKRPVSVYR